MKKKLLAALIVISPFFTLAQTQILNTWKDPNTNIYQPAIHKVVVAALIYNQAVRRQVEDYMITLYPGVATQSYLLTGDSIVSDEAARTREFRDKGYDGIVILKQTSEQTDHQYIPGQAPAYYTTWHGYWGWHGWGGPRWVEHYYPGTSGHVQSQWNWYMEVNVYSLISGNLIYSANTETTNPGGRVPLFEDVCNAVRSQMSEVGFLR